VIVLRSALLGERGFAHAFSLRTGGVSEGPFGTLNLGREVGDDPERVAENSARFRAELGARVVHEVSQVHGREVREVREDDPVAALRALEADGLVTGVRGRAVAVRTADCVPILLAHTGSGRVAAVHAGWRGVVARVLAAAVERLGDPARLLAAIGPHIRVGAFEVSPEVALEIAAAAHGAPVVVAGSRRPHVDLAVAVRAQLAALGVGSVDDVGGCTHAEPERFFSHRRDRGETGRHLAAIVAGW